MSEAERRTLVDEAGGDRAGRYVIAAPGRVVLARRLAARDGGVLGVVVAVVDPASLIAELAEGDASRGGVALVDQEGRVLAGAGALGGAVGESLPLAEPLRGADATKPAALGGDRPGYVAAIAIRRSRSSRRCPISTAIRASCAGGLCASPSQRSCRCSLPRRLTR